MAAIGPHDDSLADLILPNRPLGGAAGRHRFAQHALAGLILSILAFGVYWFLWWGPNHNTLGKDYTVFQPREQLLFMQAVRDGFFPLWIPGELGGVPFARYIFSGQYSPVTWLVFLWEPALNGSLMEALTFLHLCGLGMAGFFTYLVIRQLGLSALPAFGAGVVFMFNFRMLDAFRYGMSLDVVVWLPVMIYLVERILSRPRLHLALLYAIAQYMLLVPGHVQDAAYCLCFANLYLPVRAIILLRTDRPTRPWRWFSGRLACFGGAQLLSFGLWMVMLLPIILDSFPLGTRHNLGDPGFHAQRALTWVDLVYNLLFPWLADVHSGFYSSQWAWILLPMAGLTLLSGRSRTSSSSHRTLVFLFVVLLLCIMYSLGPRTPLGGMVNAVVPVLGMFRCPGRVMTVGMFAFAVITAFGIHRLMDDGGSSRHIGRLMLAGYAVFLLAGLGLFVVLTADWIGLYERSVYIPFLGSTSKCSPMGVQHDTVGMIPIMAGTLVGSSLLALGLVMLRLRGRIARSLLVLTLLGVSLAEVCIYHSRGTWMIDSPVETARSETFKDVDVYHVRTAHSLGLYNCAVPVPPMPQDPRLVSAAIPPRLTDLLVFGGAPAWQIFHQTEAGYEFPRAYVTPSVRLVQGEDLAAIAQMDPYATSVIDLTDPVNGRARSDTSLTALAAVGSAFEPVYGGPKSLSHTGVPPEAARARFAEINARVEVLEYTFNSAVFRVDTPSGGLFNYSDNYAKGWRASIDGTGADIYRTNHVFKSVVLPPGIHRVKFTYDPSSFRIGLIISLLSVCVLAGAAAACLSRVRRRRLVLGILTGMLALPVAQYTYERIYDLATRSALINFHTDAGHG